MTATTTPQPSIRPNDFLALDSLLSDEERDIRDTVRAFVQDKVVMAAVRGRVLAAVGPNAPYLRPGFRRDPWPARRRLGGSLSPRTPRRPRAKG